MFDQVGQDNKSTVRPAPPLNNQRTEVRRCSAIGQTFGIVVQTPPAFDEINGRASILNDCPILDEYGETMTAFLNEFANVLERPQPQHCIGADPISSIKPGGALMRQVLDVGGRTSNALK